MTNLTDSELSQILTDEMHDWRGKIADAQAKGLCVVCLKTAKDRIHSAAGRSEYQISGVCEVCFDRMFLEEEEDGEPEPPGSARRHAADEARVETPMSDPEGFAQGGTLDRAPADALIGDMPISPLAEDLIKKPRR